MKTSFAFIILLVSLKQQVFAQEIRIIDRDSFSLQYPADWKLDTKSKDYEPDSTFSIKAPGKLNNVSFFIKYQKTDAKKYLEYMVNNTTATFRIKKAEFTDFNRWGNLAGEGKIIKGKEMGSDVIIALFVYSANNRSLLVIENYREGKIDKLREEFNSIATSFKFKRQY